MADLVEQFGVRTGGFNDFYTERVEGSPSGGDMVVVEPASGLGPASQEVPQLTIETHIRQASR